MRRYVQFPCNPTMFPLFDNVTAPKPEPLGTIKLGRKFEPTPGDAGHDEV